MCLKNHITFNEALLVIIIILVKDCMGKERSIQLQLYFLCLYKKINIYYIYIYIYLFFFLQIGSSRDWAAKGPWLLVRINYFHECILVKFDHQIAGY